MQPTHSCEHRPKLFSSRRSLYSVDCSQTLLLSVVLLHCGLLWTTAQHSRATAQHITQGWEELLGTTSACLSPLPCSSEKWPWNGTSQSSATAPRKAGKIAQVDACCFLLGTRLKCYQMGSRELLESKTTAVISTGCIRHWSNQERWPGLPWWARWLLFRYYNAQFRNPE